MSRVAILIGTRPEAVKLAPVVRALQSHHSLDPLVVATGQHREMLLQMLRDFDLEPHINLDVMRSRQSPAEVASALVGPLATALKSKSVKATVVQGDTTTAFCGALASFYEGIPVAHVEAGLRTGRIDNPFPEEGNRRLITPLASWNFCPTITSKENLLDEQVAEGTIEVTGNTVIDSLLWAVDQPPRAGVPRKQRAKRALVTLHRRESQGGPMSSIAKGLRYLVERHDLEIVLPVHKSPAVRDALLPALGDAEGVNLIEPLDYVTLTHTMRSSDFVMTDSGGIQEEAPTLRKPVLVLRETTERPEAIEAGVARLVGTQPGRIVAEAERLLQDETAYLSMVARSNPFGDGRASERIVDRLAAEL